MTNNNLGGSNQFGNYQLQPAYGDVKKQTALTRAAPISGAPVSALEAPRQAQRATQRPRSQAQARPPVPAPSQPQVAPEQVYAQIAQIPGVTPVWRQLLG